VGSEQSGKARTRAREEKYEEEEEGEEGLRSWIWCNWKENLEGEAKASPDRYGIRTRFLSYFLCELEVVDCVPLRRRMDVSCRKQGEGSIPTASRYR
jgi:hypothetical protein